jgi:Dolichyl-phosphate-mannose-protein mannosyltransferase
LSHYSDNVKGNSLRVKVIRSSPAILCALMLPLCAFVIRPVAELGIDDDWGYIKTVQVLAQTGHVVYNGWEAPMLGWALYLAAIFVKLFGFSFTVARSSTVLIAIMTAFLMQRTFVRAGIREWNATIGTLTFVLSPLFLPLAFRFMTDMAGLFCVVLCLYACLRALQARTDRSALAWICFATLSNAAGGTVRQIAWLGALIMVPSALWLTRRRPHFLLVGGLASIASFIFIFASLRWFHHQPYSLSEGLIQGRIGLRTIANLIHSLIMVGLDTPLFLLPVLLMFIPALPRGNRKATIFLAAGGVLCLLFALVQYHRHKLNSWLAPFLGNEFTIHGLVDGSPLHSERPVLLSMGVRLLLTSLVVAGLLWFFALLLTSMRKPSPDSDVSAQISWRDLGVLIAPFTLAYIALLAPRGAFVNVLYDRYLLSLVMLALLVVLRCYQEQIRPRLPAASLLLVAIFAAFAIAGTHDVFAMYRARLAAVNELRSGGVPATAIDAGFDYNGWTQIETFGYINDPRILVPAGAFRPVRDAPFGACTPLLFEQFPAISPRYTLAFDPAACMGQAGFAPVTYRTWLGPRFTTIYVVKVANPQSK